MLCVYAPTKIKSQKYWYAFCNEYRRFGFARDSQIKEGKASGRNFKPLPRECWTNNEDYLNQFKWYEAPNGYIMANVFGKNMYEHRIVWELHNGPIPSDKEIHHINGITTDNRLENLKLVSHKVNMQLTKKTNYKKSETLYKF